MRFSYSVGRVPLSLLRVSGVVLISRASEVILAMSSGGLDSTSTFYWMVHVPHMLSKCRGIEVSLSNSSLVLCYSL